MRFIVVSILDWLATRLLFVYVHAHLHVALDPLSSKGPSAPLHQLNLFATSCAHVPDQSRDQHRLQHSSVKQV